MLRGTGWWICVLGMIVVSGPKAQDAKGAAGTDLGRLAWLSGTWVSVAGDTRVEERWTPAEGGSMLGVSRTIKGGRMVGFEFLRITEREGRLTYLAQPGGRYPPTAFALAHADASTVTFENLQHDFPKTIRYAKRPDGGIEARVSGTADQPTQSWVYEPGKP